MIHSSDVQLRTAVVGVQLWKLVFLLMFLTGSVSSTGMYVAFLISFAFVRFYSFRVQFAVLHKPFVFY